MREKTPSGFRFRLDEENPDELFHAELQNAKIDKLGQRITLVAILIPLLMGLVLFVAFLDVRGRFLEIQSSGTVEAQSLAKDLQSSFSSLSIHYAKLEDSLTQKISGVESSAASLREKIDGLEQAVNKLGAEKAERSEVGKWEQPLAEVSKTVNAVHSAQEKLASDLKSHEDALKKELGQLSGLLENLKNDQKNLVEDLKNDQKNLAARIGTLSSEKLDKKGLEAELAARQKASSGPLDELRKHIMERLEGLDNNILNVEKDVDANRRAIQETAKKIAATPPAPKPPAASRPKPLPSEVKPGTILEQDIKQ